ncbi:MAG: TolC family protein [Deltaproteobacteria bacterium]|nr:TolC family protein [Deltaproteobacteria bacterium]
MKIAKLKIPVLLSGILCLSVLMPGIMSGAAHAKTFIWAPQELTQIINEGLENNKEIQSLEAIVESLKEKAGFAGSLNDPRIGIAVLNLPTDSFRFDEQPMTQKQLFIAQKIPWFGKLDLKSQRVLLMATRQEAVLLAKQLEIAKKVANAYYKLGFIHYSQEINKQLTGMMGQILSITETQYSSGRGLQQDIYQAQVEISKLLDEKIILEKKRRIMEDRINGLLNRKSFMQIKPPIKMTYPELNLSIPDLQTQALKQNPWLKVKAIEIDQAKIGIELANKEYWPDIDFKLAYGQRDEDIMGRDLTDFVSASMMMNVPLWKRNRQDKNLASISAGHQAAVKAYKNLMESLPHKIDALSTEVLSLQKSYRLYADTLISQTKEWAHSSLTGYKVGKMEFNTMMKAQIRLLRSEQKAVNYLFNIYQKRAELEEVIGGPLPVEESRKNNSDNANEEMKHE